MAGCSALDLGLCRAQGGECRLLVAGGDRFLDLLDRAAHPAAAGAVRDRAPYGLTRALLGRLVTSHSILVPRKGALIRTAAGWVNPAKMSDFSGVSSSVCACRRRRSC